MTRMILALALLVSVPAMADDDVLDSPQTASDYPTLIKRAEKRDRDNNLVCGVVVRCKLPTEKECRVQYKSEQVDGTYSVVYTPGTSQVKRGKNGALTVDGTFAGDVRVPAPGIPAPTMTYTWEFAGQLSYDDNKKLFSFTQKQQATSIKASYNNHIQDAGQFGLNDVHHCSGMIQIAP